MEQIVIQQVCNGDAGGGGANWLKCPRSHYLIKEHHYLGPASGRDSFTYVTVNLPVIKHKQELDATFHEFFFVIVVRKWLLSNTEILTRFSLSFLFVLVKAFIIFTSNTCTLSPSIFFNCSLLSQILSYRKESRFLLFQV